jgi:hypothetical protein
MESSTQGQATSDDDLRGGNPGEVHLPRCLASISIRASCGVSRGSRPMQYSGLCPLVLYLVHTVTHRPIDVRPQKELWRAIWPSHVIMLKSRYAAVHHSQNQMVGAESERFSSPPSASLSRREIDSPILPHWGLPGHSNIPCHTYVHGPCQCVLCDSALTSTLYRHPHHTFRCTRTYGDAYTAAFAGFPLL